MGGFIPDYMLREQTAVAALVVFGLMRILSGAVRQELSISRTAMHRFFFVAAALYCMPQLLDLMTDSYLARVAGPALEGKLLGCAIAFLGAPVLSHKMGFE